MIARTPGDFSVSEVRASGASGRWRSVAADPVRRRLFAITALTFGAFGVVLVADLPLVDHFGGGAIGYAMLTTLWGVGAVAGSVSATRLSERSEAAGVKWGTSAMALGIGAIAVAPNLPVAIAVGAVGGFGSGLAFPPWLSLLQRCTPDGDRGTAVAMAETFEQSAFVLAMVLAGGVVGLVGPQPTYLVPALVLLAAARLSNRPSPADARRNQTKRRRS